MRTGEIGLYARMVEDFCKRALEARLDAPPEWKGGVQECMEIGGYVRECVTTPANATTLASRAWYRESQSPASVPELKGFLAGTQDLELFMLGNMAYKAVYTVNMHLTSLDLLAHILEGDGTASIATEREFDGFHALSVFVRTMKLSGRWCWREPEREQATDRRGKAILDSMHNPVFAWSDGMLVHEADEAHHYFPLHIPPRFLPELGITLPELNPRP